LTANLLVNAVYPIEYFTLPGVDEVQYPDKFWWASKQRFAALFPGSDGSVYTPPDQGGQYTKEVLEIDLGRIREVNYVNMDVLRVPVDVTIEYDAISAPDRTSLWTPVAPVEGQPFDDRVFFDAGNRAAWLNADYVFATKRGNMVHTRYLRFTFTRRTDAWPVATSSQFKWAVMVKHMRIGRFISSAKDTVGPLLAQDTPADLEAYVVPSTDNALTREVKQQFRVPASAARGGDVWPNILGFGLLAQVEPVLTEGTEMPTESDVSLSWSLWDVSDGLAPNRLLTGIHEGSYDVGLNWINWYLEDQDAIPTNPDTLYEFRVLSLNDTTVNQVSLTQQFLSSTPLPGTLAFVSGDATVAATAPQDLVLTEGAWVQTPATGVALQVDSMTSDVEFELTTGFPSASAPTATASRVYPVSKYDPVVGDYVQDGSRNLVMRVWADVADEGRDFLGNSYRYGVRREKAQYVVDGNKAGWMSDPVPSPDGVESLYFDLREWSTDDNEYLLRLIDGVLISARTPGVKMNAYYSRENVQGDKPVLPDEWDHLLWTPVAQTSWTLRSNEHIEFPQPVRCAYVKLEFTSLNPLPWRVPTFPPLPPKVYRRFPTWVEDQFTNSQLRNVVEDWWLRSKTPVQTQVLDDLTDPVLEFEYKEREFFSALALGEVKESQLINTNLVNTDERSVFDPVTGSKIFLSYSDKYKSTLLASVDQDSVLGRMVVQRFDPFASGTTERQVNPVPLDAIPTVSSTNNRVSEAYSHLVGVPMRFNRTCRHVYREDAAEFNRKAYFVGIDEVQFIRNRYTVKHDDDIIKDVLADDVLLEDNTWERETGTQIEDGQTVYVTYQNDTQYTDEAVTLTGTLPVKLEGQGGTLANVLVYSSPSKLGVQYWQNDDWVVDHKRDEDGVLTHWISRSVYTQRMGVPEQPTVYADAAVVVGRAAIPAPPTEDSGVVVGAGTVLADEGPYAPSYGTGTYGGPGPAPGGQYDNMASAYADAATSVGDGDASVTDEGIQHDDGATATGVAVLSGAEDFTDV